MLRYEDNCVSFTYSKTLFRVAVGADYIDYFVVIVSNGNCVERCKIIFTIFTHKHLVFYWISTSSCWKILHELSPKR